MMQECIDRIAWRFACDKLLQPVCDLVVPYAKLLEGECISVY